MLENYSQIHMLMVLGGRLLGGNLDWMTLGEWGPHCGISVIIRRRLELAQLLCLTM
jgi:hypothetical protein